MTKTSREDELAAFCEEYETLLRQALTTYAEHMEKAAQEARTAYEAGQQSPEVRAAQDDSLMTNNGYRQLAEIAEDCAGRARTCRSDLNRILFEDDGE